MTTTFFPLERLRLFAAEGAVYRAFHHLIAARMVTLLLVPLHQVTGRVDAVVDGCPVPWEEVHAVLEYPAIHPLSHPHKWASLANRINKFQPLLELVGLDPSDCVMDTITPMVNGEERVLRLVHPCGVRLAVVMN